MTHGLLRSALFVEGPAVDERARRRRHLRAVLLVGAITAGLLTLAALTLPRLTFPV